MSMLYSVIRIIPPMKLLHRIAYFSAVLFGLMWAGLLIQKLYICANDQAWELLPAPQCHLGESVGIVELVSKYIITHWPPRCAEDLLQTADFISDGVLVVIPLRLLWGVNMPRHMRKLLFSIFSASILVTVVSIIHAVYLLGPSGLLEGLTANVEVRILSSAMENHRLINDSVFCITDSRQPCGYCDTHIPSCQKRRRHRKCLIREFGLKCNTCWHLWSTRTR
jgi:hypothetical protein